MSAIGGWIIYSMNVCYIEITNIDNNHSNYQAKWSGTCVAGKASGKGVATIKKDGKEYKYIRGK